VGGELAIKSSPGSGDARDREDLSAEGFARTPPEEHRHAPLPSASRDATVLRMLGAVEHASVEFAEHRCDGSVLAAARELVDDG
jgi:hypothetical protein